MGDGPPRETTAEELARFLHDREEEILVRWERFTAECVPASQTIPRDQWRDHMPLLIQRLLGMADELASSRPPRMDREFAEAVAFSRLAQGLEFAQHFDELTLLRLAIMQLWRDTHPRRTAEQSETLEELVDFLVREVVKQYSDARESLVRALDRIASVGLERRPFEEQLQTVVEIIVQEVPGVDTAALLLCEGDRLHLRATVGLEADRDRAFSLKVGDGFAGRIAAERRPRQIGEAEIASEVTSPELKGRHLRALYGVPIPGPPEPAGVLHIGSRRAGEFNPVAVHVLGAVANRVGQIVLRERERSLLEAAALDLARERAQLQAVLESVPDGLIAYGSRGEILRTNERARHLAPHLTPEALALPIEQRVRRWPVDDEAGRPLAPGESPAERALRGEVVHSVTLRIPPPDEDEPERWLSASAAPIRLEGGEVTGAVVTLADVTDLRRLQQHQESLIRMVSHDLRTPLSTVTMQAEMLLRRTTDPECLRRAKTIKTGAHRMEVMIKDLVDSARQETGHLTLDLRPTDLPEFLENLRARLSGVLAMERVQVHSAGRLPLVLADADRLERILVNLVSNALKYSEPDAPVVVECRPERRGVEVAVIDRGVGIDAGELPHIFERYYRATRTKGTEGLGLGLSITRMLVAAHGGRIKVESTPGLGSTFTVWLPEAEPGGGAQAHAGPSP
ncbi:MAG TPA: ATP-binding protein [Myxococcales bacterium]